MTNPSELEPQFLLRRPHGWLGRYVEAVWFWRGTVDRDGLDRMLPTGSAGFVINLAQDETRIYDCDTSAISQRFDGSGFSGAHFRPFTIDTAEQRFAAGVEFRPGGARAFFDVAQDELANAHVPLSDLWGCAAECLRERLMTEDAAAGRLDLLETALRERFRPSRERRADVDRLLLQIANDPTARRGAALLQDASVGRRRLARLFELEVGTTPKRYARLLRFRRLLREIHRAQAVDWPSLALDCGYYDQAHLIRDFRAFSGFSPTEYLAHARDLSNHVPVD